MAHDRSLTIPFASLGSDPDGNPLRVGWSSSPQHGTLTVDGAGDFVYTPDALYVGTDSFEFQLGDGLYLSGRATVTIDVTNAAPEAGQGTYDVHHGVALEVSASDGVLSLASDPDGDAMTASLASGGGPAHGTLTLNADGSFRYVPEAGFAGSDGFTYRAWDGIAYGAPTNVVIDVTDFDPVPEDDSYDVQPNTALHVAADGVLANDFDPDAGDQVTASVETGPQHGQLTLNADGSFDDTPDAGYIGSDSFTYRASDGARGVTATVTLDVHAANAAPVVEDGRYDGTHDRDLEVDPPGLKQLASDSDGDALTFSVVTGPTHGTLDLNDDGSFTYTPDDGYFGGDGFTYNVRDGLVDSDPATVTIHVTNSLPTATPHNYSTQAGQTLTVFAPGVLTGAADADNDSPLTAALGSRGVSHGTLTLNSDGSFTYTPTPGYYGPDEFTFKVHDGYEYGAEQTARIDVRVGPLSVWGEDVTGVTEGANSGTVVVARFDDPLGGLSTSPYWATIYWGDGSAPEAGVIVTAPRDNAVFAVQGQHTYQHAGLYTVTVTVEDTADHYESVVSTVTVSDAPIHPLELRGVGVPIEDDEGVDLEDILVATFTDGDDPEGGYLAEIDWGDGSAPSAGSIIGFGVYGDHKYDKGGSYLVKVTITDGHGYTTEVYTTATVRDRALNATPGTRQATTGQALVGTLLHFTDQHEVDDPLPFTATINWGDGTAPSAGTIVGTHDDYMVSGSHTYAHPGEYVAWVTIQDDPYSQTIGSVTITVTDPLPYIGPLLLSAGVLPAVEGLWLGEQPQQGQPPQGHHSPEPVEVATFLGWPGNPALQPADYLANISWGDGTTTPGIVEFDPERMLYKVLGTHRYSAGGVYALGVVVIDVLGHVDTAYTTAVVGLRGLTAGGQGEEAAANGSGNLLLAEFGDPNMLSVAGDFTATVWWGDDSAPTTGTVLGGGGHYAVVGGHNYAHPGTYTVHTVIVGDDGDFVDATATLTVFPGLEAGSATISAAFRDENTYGTADDFTAAIDWGDGIPVAAAVQQFLGTSNFSVTGSHTFTDPGLYQPEVRVEGDAEANASWTVPVGVADAVPVLTASGESGVEGMALQDITLGTFTDPAWEEGDDDYSVVVSWGDDPNVWDGGVSLVDHLDGSFTIKGSHTYKRRGDYTVLVLLYHGNVVTADAAGISIDKAPVTASNTVAVGEPVAATLNQAFANAVVATFSDADPDRPANQYTAKINWGDGTPVENGSIVKLADGTFQVRGGSHTYHDLRSYAVTTTITSSYSAINDLYKTVVEVRSSAHVTRASGLSVAAVNLAATKCILMTDVHLATIFDSAGAGGPAGYAAEVDWGDGRGPVAAEVRSVGGQLEVFAPSLFYTQAGQFAVTVRVAKLGQGPVPVVASDDAIAVVGPAAASGGIVLQASPLQYSENVPGSYTVATFTDQSPPPALADYAAIIDWGDGYPEEIVQVAAGPNGLLLVGASHAYGRSGTYLLTVTVKRGSVSVTTHTTAVVHLPAITSSSGRDLVVAGEPRPDPGLVPEPRTAPTPNHTLHNEVLARFATSGPGDVASRYRALIDWGDGTGLQPGTVYRSIDESENPVFVVAGSHSYDKTQYKPDKYPGLDTYKVRITVWPYDAATQALPAPPLVMESTVHVTELAEGDALTNRVFSWFRDANQFSTPEGFTADISWGDTPTPEWEAARIESKGPSEKQLYSVDAKPENGDVAHSYTSEGDFPLKVRVSKDGEPAAWATHPTWVADVPLMPGTMFQMTGQAAVPFAPQSVAQFLNFSPVLDEDDYLATIDWGDGSTSQGVIEWTPVAGFAGVFEVVGPAHTYLLPGTYTITTVIQGDGGSIIAVPAQAVVTAAPRQAWTLEAGYRENDPDRALFTPAGHGVFAPNTGGLRLSHALDFDLSPGTDVGLNPQLVYNSDTVAVRPLVEANFKLGTIDVLNPSVQARLIWDGVAGPWQTFSTSGLVAGDVLLMTLEAPGPFTYSAAHTYQVELTASVGGVPQTFISLPAVAGVVVRDQSPFGAGWSLNTLSRLVLDNDGALLVYGSGDSRYFIRKESGSFISPPDEMGVLEPDCNGTGYAYLSPGKTRWMFDNQGVLTSIVDPHGLTWLYAYDAGGRLASVTNPDGSATTFEYGAGGYIIHEPGNRNLVAAVGTAGNLDSLQDVDNTVRTFTYSGHKLTSDVWGPETVQYQYDPNSGMLQCVNRGGGVTLDLVAAAGHGRPGAPAAVEAGAKASLKDALNHWTFFTLDLHGRASMRVAHDGSTQRWVRDFHGQVVLSVDPLLRTTSYVYDYTGGATGYGGDLILMTTPDQQQTHYAYNRYFHKLTAEIDPLGHATNFVYNSRGDLVSQTDAEGGTTRWEYTPDGLLTKVIDPRHNATQFFYDTSRRLIETRDPLQNSTWIDYDTRGNVEVTTDALLRDTVAYYDARNRLTEVIDAEYLSSTWEYDAVGHVTGQTERVGRGWLTQVLELPNDSDLSLMRTTAFAYDLAGNLTQTTGLSGILCQEGELRIFPQPPSFRRFSARMPTSSSRSSSSPGISPPELSPSTTGTDSFAPSRSPPSNVCSTPNSTSPGDAKPSPPRPPTATPPASLTPRTTGGTAPRQDRPGRTRRTPPRHSPRPPRHLRAPTDPRAPTPPHRLRREDLGPGRPGPRHARHPGHRQGTLRR